MKYLILPVFILATGLSTPVVQAETSLYHSPLYHLSQNNNQSLEQAVESIKQQTGGRILSAHTVQKDNHQFHKIKVLLPSGKVRVFRVNAGK